MPLIHCERAPGNGDGMLSTVCPSLFFSLLLCRKRVASAGVWRRSFQLVQWLLLADANSQVPASATGHVSCDVRSTVVRSRLDGQIIIFKGLASFPIFY